MAKRVVPFYRCQERVAEGGSFYTRQCMRRGTRVKAWEYAADFYCGHHAKRYHTISIEEWLDDLEKRDSTQG